MRLWHNGLIEFLPQQMLISQWRECIAIKKQWEKNTLKHRLVSYVLNYNKSYFYTYTYLIVKEMKKRNIKYQEKYIKEIYKFCYKDTKDFGNYLEMYPEHNQRYLQQCLFNLEEKYDRGIISQQEWEKIYKNFQKVLDIH